MAGMSLPWLATLTGFEPEYRRERAVLFICKDCWSMTYYVNDSLLRKKLRKNARVTGLERR